MLQEKFKFRSIYQKWDMNINEGNFCIDILPLQKIINS